MSGDNEQVDGDEDPVIGSIEELAANEREFAEAFAKADPAAPAGSVGGGAYGSGRDGDLPAGPGGEFVEGVTSGEPSGVTTRYIGSEPHTVKLTECGSWTETEFTTSDGVLITATFFGTPDERQKAAEAYAQFQAHQLVAAHEDATVAALDDDLKSAMAVGGSLVDRVTDYSGYALAWGLEPEDAMRMQAVRDAFKYAKMHNHMPLADIVAAAEAFESFYKYGGDS